MTTQTDTLDAVLLRLAAMEKSGGTGRVPLLDPALMRAFQHPVGPTCLPGCRGWVLDPVTAALNLPEALVKADFYVEIKSIRFPEPAWQAIVQARKNTEFLVAMLANDPLLALALAAERATLKGASSQ